MKKKKKFWGLKFLLKNLIMMIIVAAVLVMGINVYVVESTSDQIAADLDSYEDTFTEKEIDEFKELGADCIMILGASVHADGTPSPMLKDRLDTGIALYHAGVAPKLLLTGDDGQKEYNEVIVMHEYALDHGVAEEDMFLDHAGFSTYESAYRAEYVFQVKTMIVVTQEYHLYRSIYCCNKMGMEVLGAAANQKVYMSQFFREIREILARNKDFAKMLLKPEPTFLGETIPINGNGISTH